MHLFHKPLCKAIDFYMQQERRIKTASNMKSRQAFISRPAMHAFAPGLASPNNHEAAPAGGQCKQIRFAT